MTKLEYLLTGVLAGSSARVLIEDMEQAKMDRCRKVAKDTKVPLEQVVAVASLDPTPSGSYIDWLVRVASKGELPPKDEIGQTLQRFEKLKKLPAFTADKNVLSYKTWADLEQAVTSANAITSRTEQDRQIRAFSKYVFKLYPYVDKKGNPLIIGGYPQWIERIVRSGNAVLPEDAESILELIAAFERKKKDPHFRSSKNIMTYRTRAELSAALVDDVETAGATATPRGFESIPDGPGIKKLDSTTINGHYYELYAITTAEMAALHFAKTNFPLGKVGWCVKSPAIFRDQYHMGPKNPAYFFRKDGVPYVLTDLRSGLVNDQNDTTVTPDIIFELLYLKMPDNVKENILKANKWTNKYREAIMDGGPNQAIVQAFEEASSTKGSYAEQWSRAVDSAVQFMKLFGWAYPPTEAMEYLTKSPIIAMAYAVFVERSRIKELEPVILSHPRAAAAYYDYFNRGTSEKDAKGNVLFTVPGGQFEQHKWPELYNKINDYLEQMEHIPLTVYAAYSGQVMPEDKTFTYQIPGKNPQTCTWGQVLTQGAPWSVHRYTGDLLKRYKLAVETNGDYINQVAK